MTRARKEQICLDETPYYHCICRCVRRAFLCGDDKFTGKNLDHRKQWLVDKIHQLAGIFSIDICAYAIMSNHYHLVLKVDKTGAEQLSDFDVVMRWKELFRGHVMVDRWLSAHVSGGEFTQAEKEKAAAIIHEWRQRLFDIGWFMRCINESVAVKANKEDNCKGRFWEGRFKSQALLDETALLACMAYVDLNPIRAAICQTPETSGFTSIQQRLMCLAKAVDETQTQPANLLPFIGYQAHRKVQLGLPFKLLDYFALVEWTGRCIRTDKRGAIPAHIRPIFERFNVNEADWLAVIQEFNRHFINAAGSPKNMVRWAISTERKWCATHQDLCLYQ